MKQFLAQKNKKEIWNRSKLFFNIQIEDPRYLTNSFLEYL